MKQRKLFSSIYDWLFILIFIYLLIFPQYASSSTKKALEFCANTLIPSLFIYTVLSKTVISLPITQKMANRVGISTITFIIGTLCGCPIGAKTSVSLYESGKISKEYAEYLCSFTNNASISFILGFVGGELLGDVYVGVQLVICQLIASFITAIIMKFLIFGKNKLPKATLSKVERISFRESLIDASLTMINLTSCVVFFVVISESLSQIVHFSDIYFAIFKSILEFSSGCAESVSLGSAGITICAFSLGHCGASVMLQAKSVISNKLSIKPYILGKLISCTVMTILVVIFG